MSDNVDLLLGLCAHNGAEIKCPLRKGMIGALLRDTPPPAYIPQMQFGMYVTGLMRWELVLYTPEPQIPSRIWTVARNERAMDTLAEVLPKAIARVSAGAERITERMARETKGQTWTIRSF